MSAEEVVDKPWSVDEVAGGRLVEDFTDLSDLTGLSDFTDLTDEDFFSTFLSSFFFFSTGTLKPEELWPSTTPTTDTSARSTRVGLRVSISLVGVEDFASHFSFLSLYEGVESCSQCIQAAGGVSTQGSEPFFLSRQRAHTEC